MRLRPQHACRVCPWMTPADSDVARRSNANAHRRVGIATHAALRLASPPEVNGLGNGDSVRRSTTFHVKPGYRYYALLEKHLIVVTFARH